MTPAIVPQLLAQMEQLTVVREYGDAWLVDLPFSYSDGDSIRLLVESFESAYRISDRSAMCDRLAEAGVSASKGRANSALNTILTNVGFDRVQEDDGEIFAYADTADLGRTLLVFSQVLLRAEQLRWFAGPAAERSFVNEIRRALRRRGDEMQWKVRTDAPVRLISGRVRHITASIAASRSNILLQALGRSEPDRAIDRAYFTFAKLDPANTSLRMTVLSGVESDWPEGTATDLGEVSTVQFLQDPERPQELIRQLQSLDLPQV